MFYYIVFIINASLLSFAFSLFLFGYELKSVKINGKDKLIFSWGYQHWKSKNKNRLEVIKERKNKIKELRIELKQLKKVNKILRKKESKLNKKKGSNEFDSKRIS